MANEARVIFCYYLPKFKKEKKKFSLSLFKGSKLVEQSCKLQQKINYVKTAAASICSVGILQKD